MSTHASSGTGLLFGGGGNAKPAKIMSPDGCGCVVSGVPSAAAWYAAALCSKMIADIVRP